jgi:hypothetical protein
MKKNLLLLFVALSGPAAALADPLSIVRDGFAALEAKGANEALTAWLRGSALEGDTTTRLGVVGGIAQIEAAYGHMDSFEILASYAPSNRMRRVYVVAYHPKGPVFYNFDLYKTASDWVIYMMNVNTKAQVILPEELIDKNASSSPDPTPASVTPAAAQPARKP